MDLTTIYPSISVQDFNKIIQCFATVMYKRRDTEQSVAVFNTQCQDEGDTLRSFCVCSRAQPEHVHS